MLNGSGSLCRECLVHRFHETTPIIYFRPIASTAGCAAQRDTSRCLEMLYWSILRLTGIANSMRGALATKSDPLCRAGDCFVASAPRDNRLRNGRWRQWRGSVGAKMLNTANRMARLPCERDNPSRPFNVEAGGDLTGDFLLGDAPCGVDDHVIHEDSHTLRDRLAGYLSLDSLCVRAVRPVDHVDLADGAAVGAAAHGTGAGIHESQSPPRPSLSFLGNYTLAPQDVVPGAHSC